jgi:hypothetical protein
VAIDGGSRYLAAMMKIRSFLVGVLALLAVPGALSAAEAAHAKKHPAPAARKTANPTAQPIGSFDAWTAYVSQDTTGKVCYLAGPPQKSTPAGVSRQSPMAMVTHRPSEKIANVVSFVEGYPLKEGSDVALDVGSSKFELFTKDDSAWARTSELDKTIVTTLAKAGQAVVKGTPQKGPPTTDTYQLAGFARALAAIDKACGIKREEKLAPTKAAASPPPAHHKAKSAGN